MINKKRFRTISKTVAKVDVLAGRKENLAKRNVIFSLMILSMLFGVDSSAGVRCEPYIESFFQMPLKERIAKLPNYNIETQYEIYLCGNQVVHPPAIYLTRPLASQGKPVADLLKSKLATATDDVTTHDIISVFLEMKKQGTYDVTTDTELQTLMTSKVAGMKDSFWKERCEQMLAEIRSDSVGG